MLELTGGGGVDHVVEVGGPDTLGKSLNAVKVGGNVALIGVLTGVAGNVPTLPILQKAISVRGVNVGSRADVRGPEPRSLPQPVPQRRSWTGSSASRKCLTPFDTWRVARTLARSW